ncbi:MAG TPA: Eco29kI family restriction endonuclease [Pyrinomonadaceae bacterium]|nr:Eco29kI family restriction endonuclease [Pyrinomonadaceae bacterium]
MEIIEPFNPLSKTNLGLSVAEALLQKAIVPLPPERFVGAGVYAIYYSGDFPAYEPISEKNSDGKWLQPIYVGKAIPEGARRGGLGLDIPAGSVLSKRLNEHAKSIREVSGLEPRDFACRYLIVDDIWIPLGESLLIEMFRPLWNVVVDGFGNHDPGSGRYKQQRSPWDMLHPGRLWAEKCQPGRSADDILSQIALHYG